MSKKWLLGACGALLAGGLFASTANASLQVSVVITGMKSGTDATFKTTAAAYNTAHQAELTAAGLPGAVFTAGAGFAPVLSAGEQIRFDIFATIIGADADPSNEALQYIAGNLVTSLKSGTGATTGGSFSKVAGQGNYGFNPYVGTGTSDGGTFVAADGNTNVGSGTFTEAFGPNLEFACSFPPPTYYKWDGSTYDAATQTHPVNAAWLPGTWPDPTPIDGSGTGPGATPAGIKIKVGSAIFTVGTVLNGQTNLNFGAWKDDQGATYFKSLQWFEDIDFANANPGDLDSNILGAAAKASTTGTFTIGAPIVMQGAATDVPEPASLSVLALGALGLLARRRK